MATPSLWLLTSVLIISFGDFRSKSCQDECSRLVLRLPPSPDENRCATDREYCLMEVVFHVYQGDCLDNEIVNLTIASIRYDYVYNHNLSFILSTERDMIRYSCNISTDGTAVGEVRQGNGVTYGFVSNSSKSCSFVFNENHYWWPTLANNTKIDLINNIDYQVTLVYDGIQRTVKPDDVNLPLYKMQFLRCCHKHSGGSKYLLIIDLDGNQVDVDRRMVHFYLQAFPPVPGQLTITFTGPQDQQFRVNMSNHYFNVSMRSGSHWSPVLNRNQVILPRAPRKLDPFESFRINWSLPVILRSGLSSLTIEPGRYEVDIMADNYNDHRERIYLTASGTRLTPPWLLFMLNGFTIPLLYTFVIYFK